MMTSGVAPRGLVQGVRIVEWPSECDAFDELSRAAAPMLVLVAEGCDPPIGSDCCHDWMWSSGDEHELRLRVRQLTLRALGHGHGRPYLDSLGMLHVGPRSVHLAPKERALADLLLERFNQAVPARELVDAVWPGGISGTNVLANRITGLRARIAWLGLEIVGSSKIGYSMAAQAIALGADTGEGFEDAVDGGRSRPSHPRPNPALWADAHGCAMASRSSTGAG